jgi:Calcineurin-like phosphoesterase
MGRFRFGPHEDLDASRRASVRDRYRAGWPRPGEDSATARWRELLRERRNPKWEQLSWVTLRALAESVNDRVARIDNLINGRRMRWMAAQRAAGATRAFRDNIVDHPVERGQTILVLGDPGEADSSQYAVVEPLLEVGRDSAFMVVMSDVVYPAGDVNDYVNAFYIPYARYPKPIYALPGNHDWYDGLNGFMFHFCDAEPLAPVSYRRSSFTLRERLARTLWRRANRPRRAELYAYRSARPPWSAADNPGPPQPGPYFAIDVGPWLLVCIDTGITGNIDREQADWLVRVSRVDKPKVLLTGKPIWVDGEYHAGDIEWATGFHAPFERVDDIVRFPDHGYVAAIGGDVHNYQRYPVDVGDPAGGTRRIEYIVAGGGGAYLSATHRIPALPKGGESAPEDVRPAREESFRCFPLRGDSLAHFCAHMGRRLLGGIMAVLALLAVGAGALLALLDAIDDAPWRVLGLEGVLLVVGLLLGAGVYVLNRRAGPALARRRPGYLGAGVALVVAAAVALVAWSVARGLAAVGYRGFIRSQGGPLDSVGRVVLDAAPWAIAAVCVVVVARALLADAGRRRLAWGSAAAWVVALVIVLAAGGQLDELEPLLGCAALLVASALALAVMTMVLYNLRPLFGRFAKVWPRESHPALRRTVGLAFQLAVVLAPFIVLFAVALPTGPPWLWRGALFGVVWLAGLAGIAATAYGLAVHPAAWALLFIGQARVTDVDPDVVGRLLHEWEADPGLPTGSYRRSVDAPDADRRTALIARTLWPARPWQRRSPIVELASEIFEADEPPFFKSFLELRLEADDALTIRSFGVSGWPRDERAPQLEDEVRIPLPTLLADEQPASAPAGQPG